MCILQSMNMNFVKVFLVLLFFLSLNILNSCGIINSLAGANINQEQFSNAREAKILEIRSQKALKLSQRLLQKDDFKNADIVIYLDKPFLNKIAKQYDSSKGWIDPVTNYTINYINVDLNNGSAIMSFGILAHNTKYNVDVNLVMDCLLTFELENNNLVTNIEPFNIVPQAKAGIFLKSTEGIIENLIKINLANLSKNFPPMKMPINFANNFSIAGTNTEIKEKVNMKILNPERKVSFSLKIKEILVFDTKVMVSINIENLGVK